MPTPYRFQEGYDPQPDDDRPSNAELARENREDEPEPGPEPGFLANDITRYELGELEDCEVINLFQRLIDTGVAWQLQGIYGRTAIALINSGACHWDS